MRLKGQYACLPHADVCIYICMYTYVYTYVYICVYIHMCINMYVCVYMCLQYADIPCDCWRYPAFSKSVLSSVYLLNWYKSTDTDTSARICATLAKCRSSSASHSLSNSARWALASGLESRTCRLLSQCLYFCTRDASKLRGSQYLSICLSICLSIDLSIYKLSVSRYKCI